MDREIFDRLISRKQEVLLHFEGAMDNFIEDADYLMTPLEKNDKYSIDIAIFPPSEHCPYYIATTVGLSCYQFDILYARCELFVVLPEDYKVDMDRKENSWPIELLHELAYLLYDNKMTPMPNRVYQVFEKGHFKATNTTDAIIVFPEMFDMEMVEEQIDSTYTRFYQVVPITPDQTKKVEDVGVSQFIEYDLHDTEGPDMVVHWEPKTNKKIEQIIKHNEDSLGGK